MNAYSYFQPNPARQRRNPITTGVGLGLLAGGLLLAGGTTVAVKLIKTRDKKKALAPAKKKPSEVPLSALNGVFAEGATLEAIDDEGVLANIVPPMAITMFDPAQGDGGNAPTKQNFPFATRAETLVTRGREGEMIPLEYVVVDKMGQYTFKVDKDALLAAGIATPMDDQVQVSQNTKEQFLRLVTDLTGMAAADAYSRATLMVSKKNYLLDEPSATRDDFIRQVLQAQAPSVDWSAAPENLEVGTPAWSVWMGVDLVGQIAYQNVWANQ